MALFTKEERAASRRRSGPTVSTAGKVRTVNDTFQVVPGSTVKLHGSDAGKIIKPDGSVYKPVTKEELITEAHIEAQEFAADSEPKIKNVYKAFDRIGTVGIIAIILAGCTMGIGYSFTHKIFIDPDLEWLNWVWAISTSVGLVVGAWFLKVGFDGLKAGAFNGLDKILVVLMMGWVFIDELGGAFVRFNTDFATFYYMIFAPLTGPLVVVMSKGIELLETKSRRSRTLASIKEKRKHAEAMSQHKAPLEKLKAEEKARQMGSFAAAFHRWRVGMLAGIYTLVRGWKDAHEQAIAKVLSEAKNTGTYIEGYKPTTTKKRRTPSTKK